MDKYFGYSIEDIEFLFNCDNLKLVQLRTEMPIVGRPQNTYVCLFFRNLKEYDVEMCFCSKSEAEYVYNYFKKYIERGIKIKRVK